MAIKTVVFQLECDVCLKESEIASPKQHVKDGWRWNRYAQMPGYFFHALTCSMDCKAKWEAQFLGDNYLEPDGEIDLVTALPTRLYTLYNTLPFGLETAAFARAYRRDADEATNHDMD